MYLEELYNQDSDKLMVSSYATEHQFIINISHILWIL